MVLIPATPGNPAHNWAAGNYTKLGDDWQDELTAAIHHPVALKIFARLGEEEMENAAKARPTAILLWSRKELDLDAEAADRGL